MPAPILTDEQRARVDLAIASAESETSAEIMVVVAPRTGIYLHAAYEAGLWSAGGALLIATVASIVIEGTWPVWHVGWYVLISAAGFLAGFLAARSDAVRRFFAGEPVMLAECRERAHHLFTEHGVFGTKGRTGVLLFVSLFEHVVIVLGDRAISAKLGQATFDGVVEAAILRIKAGKLDEGLIEGVRMLGAHLAPTFPRAPDDVNELPDKVYVMT